MSNFFDFHSRQVVPIWRSFDETLRRGELDPVRLQPERRFTESAVSDLVEDWKRNPSMAIASDLVSNAWNLGLDSVAVDAARFITSSDAAPDAARSVATLYLRNAGVLDDDERDEGGDLLQFGPAGMGPALPIIEREYYVEVHETRRRLARYPRNPILWSNLARLYTTLGVQDKASQAMRVAMSLAGGNRFVIRAASRLFLHQGDYDLAHQVLIRAASVRFDPWVLAAEVAIADAISKTSKNVKTARKLVENAHHSPFQLSELASALGTIDSKAGNRKVSRRLVEFSLQVPTENSIAQADWLFRKVGYIPGVSSDQSESSEANAAFALRSGRWDVALRESRLWLIEQPFSSRPAIFGSYLAGEVFEDYELSARFAKLGLKSNPDDVPLHNNFAFALASLGRLKEAQGELTKLVPKVELPENRAVVGATQGLVAFRSGNPHVGRLFYNTAISTAEKCDHVVLAAIARVHLALEALRAGEPDAEDLRKEALDLSVVVDQRWLQVLVERLRSYRPMN
jgi:tetratricopeptide (TPR) repeat protein